MFMSMIRVQLYFHFLAFSLHFSTSGGASNHTDHLALLAIKSRITHDPHATLATWNTSLHFCQWEGVTCGKAIQVTALDLSSRGLVGYLSPYVGNLSFLRFLSFSNNTLEGGIPPEIGRLFRLRFLYLTNNSFGGEIPPTLSNCTNLKKLWLNGNKIVGKLPNELSLLGKLNDLIILKNGITGGMPRSIGNLTSLQQFFASENPLGGTIPYSFGNLRNLQRLGLAALQLSGTIPSSFYNLSSLVVLDLSMNQIGGELPRDMGLKLPHLQDLRMWMNQVTGSIPPSLSNCSDLMRLDLSYNNFSGKIGFSFGSLPNLQSILLYQNNIGNGELDDMNLIRSMVNCSQLQQLDLGGTQIRGMLPNSIGNLSAQLTRLHLGENFIYGSIPSTLGNLVGLELLVLQNNQLAGPIPSTLGNLFNLRKLFFQNNTLTGAIPNSLGNLSLVNVINLSNNRLEHMIPSDVGNCQSLALLNLSRNRLDGYIPGKLFELSSLSILLDLSQNQLVGHLPEEIKNLKNLMALDLSNNHLDGEIPDAIGSCTSLEYLDMKLNSFQGLIPSTMSDLRGIRNLDLSSNNFSGQIPRFLEQLNLSSLNLSFNNLDGEVPTRGIFKNPSVMSIDGNNKLCGGIPELRLLKCDLGARSKKGFRVILVVILLCLFLVVAIVFSLLFCWQRKKRQAQTPTGGSLEQPLSRVSYGSILKATDEFSQQNLIGTGAFSAVYKGILEEAAGAMVAIKVIKLRNQGGFKSFMAECEALKNIRHRNLVKIITSCSSVDFQGNDFKALIYEFMPNGSLERWIHPNSEREDDNKEATEPLSLSQRVRIALDVAHAIHYLHQDCEVAIIHCDLKPSNILLDSEMVAHIGDFGLAKFLPLKPHQSSSIGIRGTFGYAAPEYGLGSEMTKEGDIYSFGILLLEMMTRKRPTDPVFQQGLNLHGYVKMAFPDRLMEIIEPALFPLNRKEMKSANTYHRYSDDEATTWRRLEEAMISLARIGLGCSMESPRERMGPSRIVAELSRINAVIVTRISNRETDLVQKWGGGAVG